MVAMAGALPLHDIHDEPFPAILASEDDPALRRTGPGYGQQTAQPLRQKRQACPAQLVWREPQCGQGNTGLFLSMRISFFACYPACPLHKMEKWPRKSGTSHNAPLFSMRSLTVEGKLVIEL